MRKIDVLIKNAGIVTMNETRQIINDGAIAIAGDRFEAVGETAVLEKVYTAQKIIDAKGKFVFPGLINTHSHLFQEILKGLGRDKPLLAWLDSSVRRAIWQIDEECVYYAALVGCMENIRTGATTILDNMYCHGKPGLDDMVLKAFADLGIRGILGRAYTDTATLPADCPCELNETEEMFLSEVERLAGKYKGHPRISIALAPGIIWDVSEQGFKNIRSLADKLGLLITMHTVETEDDDEYCLANRGMRTIPYLEKIGLLGPDYISVHNVHMTPEDIAIYKKHDVKVSHNPVSNMILASGVAPIPELLAQGVTVSIATDGSASNDTQDMLEVIKTTALLHKLHTRDAAVMNAAQVVEMATLGGAKTIGKESELGQIAPGFKADLFIYNPLTARSIPIADPISTLVYSSAQANVETTIVGGELVLEEGRIVKVDEKQVLHKLQDAAASLRKRAGLGNTQWGQKMQVGSLR